MKRLTHKSLWLLTSVLAIGCSTGSSPVLGPDPNSPAGGLVGISQPDAGRSDAPLGGPAHYLAQCTITRDEALRQSLRQQPGGATGATQAYYDQRDRVPAWHIPSASLCNFGPTDTISVNAACKAAFCTKSGNPGYVLDDPKLNNFTPPPACTATALSVIIDPPPGVCAKDTRSSILNGIKHASVHCTLAGRDCTKAPQGGQCGLLAPFSEPFQNNPSVRCFDPSSISAYDFCANNWWYPHGDQDFFGYVQLDPSAVTDDDTLTCDGYINPTPILPDEVVYGVNRSAVIGTIALGSETAQLRARGGYAVIEHDCENPQACTDSQLSRMKLNLQDIMLFGIPFTNPTVELVGNTDASSGTISARTMQMEVKTNILGTPVHMLLANTQDLPISLGDGTLAISGSVGTSVGEGDGGDIPIVVNLNFNASTSFPGASCVGLSRIANLLGFEDISLWQSTQSSLVLSARPPTQGCYALDIPGNGYRVLNSAVFATPLQGTTSKLGLDFFVPSNPPNPNWLGAVQMYATCPSANMNNAYIGQVELTGKPIGAYSTLAFPIPPSINNVLTQAHPDCYFSIAVNEDQTPTPPTLDNLRFLP